MIRDRDATVRLVKELTEALAAILPKASGSKNSGDVSKSLGDLFERSVGLSASFLERDRVGLLPDMLTLSTNKIKPLLAARILVDRAKHFDELPFYASTIRRLLALSLNEVEQSPEAEQLAAQVRSQLD